ncbi:Ketosteroid isomerase homolog [Mucilaginibacter lappiensis]|uniref:Ketosteroid isomerase-like protein n=1 Tax=Mucilaginibacter lappiensis TaxID=354630 RepID=A0ABR6PD67_9SPHI|nr:nuclear transport factor 2 family protein [Mucilaginibacter lappiensis]MBB6107704.1 ketosteroid isomerase-like protein [Mucilaginibacter lappiensis]SIP99818.1 Ketosteroid isomerase homolog [Mucilaginibacter lappiensis]
MDLENEKRQIQSLIAAKIKLIYNRNIDELLANYAADVVSFDLMSPLQNNGIAPMKKRLENWFAGYKSPIKQETANLKIMVSEEIAYSHCLTRTFGINSNGEEMDMWYRTTTGYKKENGRWLITHDHNSEPIDMETGKAMFGLKP